MSFDSIPADLVLKMFRRLPFKDRVRLRGVNQVFNEVSWRSINTMRSLDINDDLVTYALMSQPFPSILESCSPILESIKVTDRSCNQGLLSALADFVYPKLKRLEITVTNNELTKKLISRNRNLRTIILHLDHEFEWPEDIVLEKLETLEFHSSKECKDNSHVNLSPTLRPLISKVPNLEHLWIEKCVRPKTAPFILSVQELNQLLVAAPCLKWLRLNFYSDSTNGPFVNMCRDFIVAMPTWHLPKLTYFFIDLNCLIPPAILQHFTTSSPQLISVVLGTFTQLDDQALMGLSKLKYLRELCLEDLDMNKGTCSKIITLLPSITDLHIKIIDRDALLALSRHKHLRAFSVVRMIMTKDEFIDVITNLPLLSYLGIHAISDTRSQEAFIEFLTSTSALFNRNLEIRFYSMCVSGNESAFDQMKAILKEVEKNGGPVVDLDCRNVHTIRYRPLA